MRRLLKRLNSKAGETLVESMAAILVFTFASIIMMSMVSAAAGINTTVKEADQAFQKQLVVAERGSTQVSLPDDPASAAIPTDPHTPGTVVFDFNGTEETIPVNVFQAEGDGLYAYYSKPGGGT